MILIPAALMADWHTLHGFANPTFPPGVILLMNIL